MIIFSQDRKVVSDCKTLMISKNIGGKKDEKYAILGSCGSGELTNRTLAFYADEKTAMLVLEHIYEAFASGEKTYKL